MAKIHELAEVLANQISAGEVIERPASVVKELVENALDAHSRQIDVHVSEAGLKTIQVIDDGDGIAADDVLNAFKRHATSKIHNRKDLFKVHSLGFRGEALPSIASVADVVLETSAGLVGQRVHLRGGQVVDQKVSTVRKGTTVTVKDLFFNTPARLKYVKSPATELANISDIVNRLALSHPEVAFSLAHNGHLLFKTAGNGHLQQTIAGVYGVNNAKKMLAVRAKNLDFKLHGFISLPELTRSSRRYITVLINGRYIKNFQLNKAIIAGYGSKLMVGRFPVVVLAIDMDPLLVDVNVHPAKQEVRLSKESELGDFIQQTIYQRIAQENLIPDANENLHSRRQVEKADQLQMALNKASAKWTSPVKASAAAATSAVSQIAETAADTTASEPITNFSNQTSLAAWDAKYQNEQVGAPFGAAQAATVDFSQARTKKERFPQLDYIGQLHGTYLLAQGSTGLYIVDQHAAQERVNYEYYRQKIGDVSADQQNLLVPLVLDYPASDAIILREKKALLQQLGLNLAPFGQNSFVLRSHPAWFKAGQEEATVREMIDYILNDQKITVAKFREKTAIMMSCKRAIKANHHLDQQQAKALLKRLPECKNPFNCPHGRPVLVHFTNQDLEKMFRRIQESHTSLKGEMG